MVCVTLATDGLLGDVGREFMQTDVQLPTAFSVQNEDEFYPIQHLLARMNPRLMVEQVATGMHRNGCHTVLWGLVYPADAQLTQADVEEALARAGFDTDRGVLQQASFCRSKVPA